MCWAAKSNTAGTAQIQVASAHSGIATQGEVSTAKVPPQRPPGATAFKAGLDRPKLSTGERKPRMISAGAMSDNSTCWAM